MTTTDRSGDRLDILFVCTANQCRSPLAEVIATELLRERGVSASVGSAGFLMGGMEAAHGSQRAAKRLGLDLSGHVSRRIDTDMIDRADIIITMEPHHVLDLVDVDPDSRFRSLTLKELARHSANNPLDPHDEGVGTDRLGAVRDWISHAGARRLDSMMSGDTSVADPMGRSDRAFRRTAKEIDALLTTVFDVWFPAINPDRPAED